MIEIEKIVNQPVASNCYIISNKASKSCIIVDPGTEDCEELLSILRNKDLNPEYVVLTHEHIDHIIGSKELLNHYNAKIICSSDCNNNINSYKYNLSGFSEQFEEKTNLPTADILLENINYSLQWGDYLIQFYKAEGHSLGSIYFNIEDDLFIGDTLIKGFKTSTVLPGGSKEKLINTLESILENFDVNTTKIYSGHYEDFYLYEIEDAIKRQIEYNRNKIKKNEAITY